MIRTILLLLIFSFPAFAMEKIIHVKTDIGIDALLVENDTNPIISARIRFETGAVNDAKDKQGLSQLYAAILDKGAGDMDAQEFQRQMYENSISIDFSAGTEDFAISLQSLSSDYEKAFSLLADCLYLPHLPQEEIPLLKQQILSQIKIQQEKPSSEIFSRFKGKIFGNSPYGYGLLEKSQSVPNLTKEDLENYKKRFGKDNILITVSGDISASELKRLIEKTFAPLAQKSEQISVPPVKFIKKDGVLEIKKQSPQSAVMFALPWIERRDKDFFTGYILNYLLGGAGLDSTLMQELREKQGLTYGTSSFIYEISGMSLLMGYGLTSTDNAEPLIAGMKKVLNNFSVTQEQLDNAKSYMIGGFPLTFVSTMDTASLLMTIQKYDLGLDYFEKRNGYINAVTLDDINSMAKKYLNTNNADFILMGE